MIITNEFLLFCFLSVSTLQKDKDRLKTINENSKTITFGEIYKPSDELITLTQKPKNQLTEKNNLYMNETITGKNNLKETSEQLSYKKDILKRFMHVKDISEIKHIQNPNNKKGRKDAPLIVTMDDLFENINSEVKDQNTDEENQENEDEIEYSSDFESENINTKPRQYHIKKHKNNSKIEKEYKIKQAKLSRKKPKSYVSAFIRNYTTQRLKTKEMDAIKKKQREIELAKIITPTQKSIENNIKTQMVAFEKNIKDWKNIYKQNNQCPDDSYGSLTKGKIIKVRKNKNKKDITSLFNVIIMDEKSKNSNIKSIFRLNSEPNSGLHTHTKNFSTDNQTTSDKHEISVNTEGEDRMVTYVGSKVNPQFNFLDKLFTTNFTETTRNTKSGHKKKTKSKNKNEVKVQRKPDEAFDSKIDDDSKETSDLCFFADYDYEIEERKLDKQCCENTNDEKISHCSEIIINNTTNDLPHEKQKYKRDKLQKNIKIKLKQKFRKQFKKFNDYINKNKKFFNLKRMCLNIHSDEKTVELKNDSLKATFLVRYKIHNGFILIPILDTKTNNSCLFTYPDAIFLDQFLDEKRHTEKNNIYLLNQHYPIPNIDPEMTVYHCCLCLYKITLGILPKHLCDPNNYTIHEKHHIKEYLFEPNNYFMIKRNGKIHGANTFYKCSEPNCFHNYTNMKYHNNHLVIDTTFANLTYGKTLNNFDSIYYEVFDRSNIDDPFITTVKSIKEIMNKLIMKPCNYLSGGYSNFVEFFIECSLVRKFQGIKNPNGMYDFKIFINNLICTSKTCEDAQFHFLVFEFQASLEFYYVVEGMLS